MANNNNNNITQNCIESAIAALQAAKISLNG